VAHYNCYLIDKKGNPVFYADKPDLTKGDLYISVSQILGMEGSGDFLINWALKEFGGQLDPIKAYKGYMDRVSDLGSKLHKFMEYDLKGLIYPESELTEAMLPGIESWLTFKQQHQLRLIDSERVLFSRKYRFAGTIDLRIEIDGVEYIADLKTGSVQDKAFTQLTAYKHMMKEMGLSDGKEKLLVLGGSDSKNKIADGGVVQMHTLETWFGGRVTEEDLFVQLMCLRQMWQQKNLKSRKFEPVIKGMAEYIDPIIQRFRDSFEAQVPTKNKKSSGRKNK
jgi:hypothetical protein